MQDNIPHTPWFIRPEPTPDGQAIIENGTDGGSRIAVAEWHVAEFIVSTVNLAHQAPANAIEITDGMVHNAALILHLRHPIYRNGEVYPFDELPTKEARLADARAALEAAFGKPMSSGQ